MTDKLRTQHSIQEALRFGKALLESAARENCDSARLDTELLLAHCLGSSRTHLATWPEQCLTKLEEQCFRDSLARRVQGEPLAYITGEQGFWNLLLKVNPAVLIPRPETELLVSLALAKINQAGAAIHIADLGTGSGAIALALASEFTNAQVFALDKSVSALRVAQDNAKSCGIENVTFKQSNWCAALEESGLLFDLVVSNPPYVAPQDPHLEQGDLRFEPRRALVAENQGLSDIQSICQQVRFCLKPGAWLMLEHGYNQGAAVAEILQQNSFHKIERHRDYNGRDRVSCAALK